MKKLNLFACLFLFLGTTLVKGQYTVLYNLTESTDGGASIGSISLSGNILYGEPTYGGTYSSGAIFSLNTNGSGFNPLFDFNGTDGDQPSYTSLIVSGTKMYGVTNQGGTYSAGNVFSINTDGSGFTSLHDFDFTDGNDIESRLAFSVTGDTLFGTTLEGGASYDADGVIYCLHTDGSDFTILHTWTFSPYTGGYSSFDNLVVSGSILYGMTNAGGANNEGCIYSINTDGSGYTVLYNFAGGASGEFPVGALILSGDTLYGMTTYGGINNIGNVFSIETNGTGYTDLLDFNGTNGYTPYGSLLLLGGTLYGMTNRGGADNHGLIFSIQTNGSGYTDLLDFIGTNGADPWGTLTSSCGVLYGMTEQGGTIGGGVVFKYLLSCSVSASIISVVNEVCNGGNSGSATANLSCGTPVYTYLWSDASSQTTATATGLIAGTYTVTITDYNGCTATASTTITQPTTLSVSASVLTNEICSGGSTGSVSAVGSNGTSPYTYSWTGGGTNSTETGLTVGTYTITLTDNCGATATASIAISQPTAISISDSILSCGSAIVYPTGGTSPYTYSWSPSSQTNQTATGLSIGTYTITVTDNNGCSNSTTVTISTTCRCWSYATYDTTLVNAHAKSFHRRDFLNCKTVLIEGTFTVDTAFSFNGCDVALGPNALINIVDSSRLNIQQDSCVHPCSHLHAACDTMWRGIFIHQGSTLFTTDETLIEDADTAVYAMNTANGEALYNLNVSTFNKNYKDVVVRPYPKYYDSYSVGCLYTCRNFDSILASYPYNCVNPEAEPRINFYGNWTTAPVASLLPPHIGGNTYIGWVVDTVKYFSDSLADGTSNTFDNMQYGILSRQSNMGIYNDLFQNIVNANYEKAAITATGTTSFLGGNKLFVGATPTMYGALGNIFLNCTTCVIADSGFSYVDISYNKMINHNNAPGSYGVLVEAMGLSNDSLFIDQDTITNFDDGIACNSNTFPVAHINYNVISADTCTNLNWTGIVINEQVGTPASYVVDTNIITTYYRGIACNGLTNNTFINDNEITLNPSGCSSYLANGAGISLQNCSTAQIGCNVITVGDTVNTYTGIVESQSQNITILNNTITHPLLGIRFNGATYTGDNTWSNTLNLATGDTGIISTNSANVTLGSATSGCDNTFAGTSGVCRTSGGIGMKYNYVSLPAFDPHPGCPLPTVHIVTGSTGLTCASILSRSRSHSALRHSPDTASIDSADLVSMQNIALSRDSLQDTASIIAKGGVLSMLWTNTNLLSNHIFSHFNDSMSNASMGEIMAIDTAMVDSDVSYTILLSTVNAITPANNIEANLQIAAQAYLELKVNHYLSAGELTTLRTLANKCSDWDGNGVYQARVLLSLFDPPSTVYNDRCEIRESHRPDKNNSPNQSTEPAFELYPNPNNGNFTLEYNLGEGEIGEVVLFNTMGQQIGVYTLNGSEGIMNVSNPNLSNGVYLWELYSNNQMIKYGKVIIIR